MELNCLRGFKDIILADAKKFNYIIDLITNIAELYNFQRSYFPIMESSAVYHRTLGESSDIVNKEMYSFSD
ncbi:MAG: histidine--tRNA ligase, partial [Rickettsiales bacterium]